MTRRESAPWAEAAERVDRWIMERHCRGWDPYDALASPLVRALAPGRWGKVAWTQLLKRASVQLRPLLGIPKLRNPKAVALALEARLRLASLARPSATSTPPPGQLVGWLEQARAPVAAGGGWAIPACVRRSTPPGPGAAKPLHPPPPPLAR